MPPKLSYAAMLRNKQKASKAAKEREDTVEQTPEVKSEPKKEVEKAVEAKKTAVDGKQPVKIEKTDLNTGRTAPPRTKNRNKSSSSDNHSVDSNVYVRKSSRGRTYGRSNGRGWHNNRHQSRQHRGQYDNYNQRQQQQKQFYFQGGRYAPQYVYAYDNSGYQYHPQAGMIPNGIVHRMANMQMSPVRKHRFDLKEKGREREKGKRA